MKNVPDVRRLLRIVERFILRGVECLVKSSAKLSKCQSRRVKCGSILPKKTMVVYVTTVKSLFQQKGGNTSNLMKHLLRHGINMRADMCTVFQPLAASAGASHQINLQNVKVENGRPSY